MFALSVGVWSLATAATALARGAASLIGMRGLLGVGESGVFPCAAGVTARWFPDRERSRVSAIYDSGSKLGAAIALPLNAWLIILIGWRGTFIICGALGLAWAVAWWIYYREPEKHKYINPAELKYIRGGQVRHHGLGGKQPMKWYHLFKYRNIWAMCLGLFAMNYVSYFFFTWFPVYLIKVHHMPMMKMGLVAAVPIVVAMFVELASGWFADRLYTKGWSITKVRKVLLVIGEVLGASIAIAVFAHTVVWAIIVMTICKSGQAIASSQVWALPGDVAPTNMASQVTSLQNMVGNIAGAVGPIVTGVILQVTQSFDLALFIIGALAVLGAMNFLFLLKKVEPIQAALSTGEIGGAALAGGSAR